MKEHDYHHHHHQVAMNFGPRSMRELNCWRMWDQVYAGERICLIDSGLRQWISSTICDLLAFGRALAPPFAVVSGIFWSLGDWNPLGTSQLTESLNRAHDDC